ncbi:MAG: 3'-5' exonuclease [Clostridia bacterium]|nr:3'-5' exonuclease [Clostridia bacterium]
MKETRYLVLDIETTGFDKENDDILQISIINQDEEVLFNEYIRPVKKTAWPEAERIHHITDAMVREKNSLEHFKPELEHIFSMYSYMLTYNGEYFDIPFMKAKGIEFGEIKSIDVMKEWAKSRNSKWRKLDQLAKELGFEETSYHDSLTDVKATKYVYEKI